MNLKGKYVLIVGGGKAGERAFRYAKKKSAEIFIIDSDPNCILGNYSDYFMDSSKISELNFISASLGSVLIQGDIETAFSLLNKFKFKYIFPTVPIHLVAKFVIYYLKKGGKEVKPDPDVFQQIFEKIPSNLIYKYNKQEAIIILSYMPDGLDCIESCSSPRVCPVTKIEKSVHYFKLLMLQFVN